ncbi:MAG: carbon storage regulator CsrA [Myxococcota bacterium]
MLTLTRKIGQKILIGNGIEIVVREVRGRQVRLGISAPHGLPVYREELYQGIAEENVKAAVTPSPDELERLYAQWKALASAGSKSPKTD